MAEAETIRYIGEESLPKPATVVQQDAPDLADLDPVESTPGKLPTIDESPPDSVLVCLHAVHGQLRDMGLHTPLTRLWENVTGSQQPRTKVVCPQPVVRGGEGDEAFVLDVMPKSAADLFAKWVGSQVFVRGLRYLECGVQRFSVTVPMPRNQAALREMLVVYPITPAGTAIPVEGAFPVEFFVFTSGQDVRRRAEAARKDPATILQYGEVKRD